MTFFEKRTKEDKFKNTLIKKAVEFFNEKGYNK